MLSGGWGPGEVSANLLRWAREPTPQKENRTPWVGMNSMGWDELDGLGGPPPLQNKYLKNIYIYEGFGKDQSLKSFHSTSNL